MKYLYYGEIQEKLESFKQDHTKKLTFVESVKALYDKGYYHDGPIKFPNFSDWDIHDIDAFFRIHMTVPVFIEKILKADPSSPESTIGNDFYPGSHFFPLMIPVNAATHYHKHPYFEIDYILKGSCQYFFETETKRLNANEMCILPPNTAHDLIAEEGCIIISINMKKEIFDDHFFENLKDDNPLAEFFKKTLYMQGKGYLTFYMPSFSNTLMIIKQLFVEFYSSYPYSKEVSLHFINILFAYIVREYTHSFFYEDYKNKSNHYTIVPAILEYIRTNFAHVTLEELSNHFNYEKAYLGKLIKQYTGYNFNEILNQYKIKKASWLLTNTSLKIDEISLECGYHHADYFFRCFKREYGVAPSVYRNTMNQR